MHRLKKELHSPIYTAPGYFQSCCYYNEFLTLYILTLYISEFTVLTVYNVKRWYNIIKCNFNSLHCFIVSRWCDVIKPAHIYLCHIGTIHIKGRVCVSLYYVTQPLYLSIHLSPFITQFNINAYSTQWQSLAMGEHHLSGLVQDCSISSALAMEILKSCTKPSIGPYWNWQFSWCRLCNQWWHCRLSLWQPAVSAVSPMITILVSWWLSFPCSNLTTNIPITCHHEHNEQTRGCLLWIFWVTNDCFNGALLYWGNLVLFFWWKYSVT